MDILGFFRELFGGDQKIVHSSTISLQPQEGDDLTEEEKEYLKEWGNVLKRCYEVDPKEYVKWMFRYKIDELKGIDFYHKGFSPEEAKAWIDRGFWAMEAVFLKKFGVSPEVAEKWKQSRFSKWSDYMVRWIEYDPTEYPELSHWVEAEEIKVDLNVADWLNAGASYNDCLKFGGDFAAYYSLQDKIGDVYKVLGVMQRCYHHPESPFRGLIKSDEGKLVALQLLRAGFGREEFELWGDNVYTPKLLDKAEFIREVECCKALGFTSREQVVKWYDNGIYLDEMPQWWEVGIKDPDVAGDWKRIGVKPEDVERWERVCKGPKEVEGWKSVGVESPEGVEAWKDVGVMDPEEVPAWRRLGFSLEEVKELKELRLTGDVVEKWIKDGGLLEELKKWAECGFVNLDEIYKWKRYGFGAESSMEWKEAGFTPFSALDWMKAGFGPNKAMKYKKEGLTPWSAREKEEEVSWGDMVAP